jgi:peptidoglycan/LPS O-acetylase OafA/YrhL
MPQLDALRFFAVMGVIIAHNWQPSDHTLIVGQVDWAELGVKLFFVLSGFLITGILIGGRDLAERHSQRRLLFVRQFYIRRFLRIFPVYYAVIVLLILAGVGGIRHVSPWLFTYTTNIYVWHNLAYPYAVPHFWTLAVEEQFYLVWPWAMLFLPRKWLVPFLLSLCCLGPIWRLWASFHYSHTDWGPAFTFTPGVVDFLAIGAVLALAAHAARSREALQRILAFVVLPVGLIVYAGLFWIDHSVDSHAPLALEDTGAALVFCWLIGGASLGFTGLPGRLLGWRPLVYLGKISYGIYIFHLLVPLAFSETAKRLSFHYENSGFANFVVTSLVTFGVAALSWQFFERPINGLKRHFRYEIRTPDVAVEEPAVTPSTQALSP